MQKATKKKVLYAVAALTGASPAVIPLIELIGDWL